MEPWSHIKRNRWACKRAQRSGVVSLLSRCWSRFGRGHFSSYASMASTVLALNVVPDPRRPQHPPYNFKRHLSFVLQGNKTAYVLQGYFWIQSVSVFSCTEFYIVVSDLYWQKSPFLRQMSRMEELSQHSSTSHLSWKWTPTGFLWLCQMGYPQIQWLRKSPTGATKFRANPMAVTHGPVFCFKLWTRVMWVKQQ